MVPTVRNKKNRDTIQYKHYYIPQSEENNTKQNSNTSRGKLQAVLS